MKNFFSALILIGFLTVLLAPLTASAVDVTAPTQCTMKREIKVSDTLTCVKGQPYDIDSSTHGVCCILNTMYNVTDWIFIIMVALSEFLSLLAP